MHETTAMKGFTLRRKMLLLVAAMNLIFTAAFTGYLYHAQKHAVMKDIDHRLFASALAIRHILPEGFHNRITSSTSVTSEEHMRNVRTLSAYAKEVGVTYLYAIMKSGDKLVFTATSATDEDFKENAVDPFFTAYDEASETLKKSFKSGTVFYENNADKYGDFRSVIVPVVMTDGRVYVVGADIDISTVQALIAEGTKGALMIGALLLFASMALSMVILRSFTASIIEVKDHVRRIIEKRDLTRDIPIHSTDEVASISRNINSLLEVTRIIVSQLKESSSKISQTSEGLAANSADLASRTHDHNDAIIQTSQSLEDLVHVTGSNAENAISVETSLKDFSREVSDRIALITDVTHSMTEINSSSAQIEKIVTVINEIAFQTNLLALNASVEAARAGEAGRGFSVVADEVRNLARKTAESSRDIQQIVQGNMEATKNGMQLVNETSKFFHNVVEELLRTVDKISEIAEGSREQSKGIEQIREALARTRTILESDVNLVSILADSGRDLHENAGVLVRLVNEFKSA